MFVPDLHIGTLKVKSRNHWYQLEELVVGSSRFKATEAARRKVVSAIRHQLTREGRRDRRAVDRKKPRPDLDAALFKSMAWSAAAPFSLCRLTEKRKDSPFAVSGR
jgi:hypothetical protein